MNKVIECIYDRRSVRHFADISLEKEVLEEIVRCGIQAPNGHNRQTWRFSTIVGGGILHWSETVLSVLERTKTDSLQGFDNPAALVIVTDRKENVNAMANGACAITTMLTAAWALGVGGCWINALRTIQDEPEIRELLNSYEIPENHMVVGTVALGYLPEQLPKKPKRRDNVIHFVN